MKDNKTNLSPLQAPSFEEAQHLINEAFQKQIDIQFELIKNLSLRLDKIADILYGDVGRVS